MKILYRHFPLFIENNNLLTYRYGNLYLYSLNEDRTKKVGKISVGVREILLSRISFLSRLLRLGVRASILLSNKILLLSIGHSIYEYDFNSLTNIAGSFTIKRSRPLYFTEIKDIDGFDNSVVFGEYYNNPHMEEVSIYKRVGRNDWKVVYTFPKGIINHIHNIIPDKYQKCSWILTGDFGKNIGIWYAKNNFKYVRPVLIGEQIYRSCIAFPTKNGLLYATDSPFEQNSIRKLSLTEDSFISQKITEIHGPVMCGCIFNNKYLFSTSVESNGIYRNKFEAFLSRKKGNSIKDYNSYLYFGDENNLRIIYSARKDILPFVLFQFGTFRFPQGNIDSEVIPVYHVATKKNNLSTVLLNIEN